MNRISQKQLDANRKNSKLGGIKTEEGKAVNKKFTTAEAKDIFKESIRIACDPEYIFNTVVEILNLKKADSKIKELKKVIKEHWMVFGLETHYAIAETVNPNYRPLVIEVARQIENEYDCKSYSEKALAELVANAYVRTIDCSRRLNNDLGGAGQSITENKTKYLTMLSKQIDRANRQFLSALLTLKQIKAPAVEMNIRAKTAFVAQNQQINVADNRIKQNENVNPK